jgi:hypothetical protein
VSLTGTVVGGTKAFLLGLGLFHILAGLGGSIPMCAGAVIHAGLRIDPYSTIGIALRCRGILRSSRLRLSGLRSGSRSRLRLLSANCFRNEQCAKYNEDCSQSSNWETTDADAPD